MQWSKGTAGKDNAVRGGFNYNEVFNILEKLLEEYFTHEIQLYMHKSKNKTLLSLLAILQQNDISPTDA